MAVPAPASRLLLGLLALLILGLAPARAETVLERILRSGELRAGTRDDAPPFAFRDAHGQLAGLSVDLIEEVRKALSARLGRAIATRTVLVTPQTRLSVVQDGQADLVCETATATWARQQSVDFTLPIFRDGTRILAYRETLARKPDLADLRIGVVQAAVTGRVLEERLPGVALHPFPDMSAALAALEAGEVDGIANVGIILRGLIATAKRPQGLVIVPRGDALGYETIACMVPQNDSAWRDFVNGVLRDLFRGIEAWRGGYVTIHDRWFGRNAPIAYPLDETTVRFFLATQIWLD